MADKFELYADNLESPFTAAAGVAPNDNTDLEFTTRGIYVGGAGDVKVTMENGSVVTFVGLVAGVNHPIRVKRIHSTGTSATNIVAVW